MEFKLDRETYIEPGIAGAFYAVSSQLENEFRHFLHRLLSERTSPYLDKDSILKLTGVDQIDVALELLYGLQSLGWIEAVERPREISTRPLELILPAMLKPLSSTGKVILADNEGFYVAAIGYSHETAVEVSALSADLTMLYDRHRYLLRNNLKIESNAYGIINTSGHSEIGFWPLFIGQARFVLIVGGIPRLNQDDLKMLIWTLYTRYGKVSGERLNDKLAEAK